MGKFHFPFVGVRAALGVFSINCRVLQELQKYGKLYGKIFFFKLE